MEGGWRRTDQEGRSNEEGRGRREEGKWRVYLVTQPPRSFVLVGGRVVSSASVRARSHLSAPVHARAWSCCAPLHPFRARVQSCRTCSRLCMVVSRLSTLVRCCVAPVHACSRVCTVVSHLFALVRSWGVRVRVCTIAGCSWLSVAERHWYENKE